MRVQKVICTVKTCSLRWLTHVKGCLQPDPTAAGTPEAMLICAPHPLPMALQGLEALKAELDAREAAVSDIESAAQASMAASQATSAKQQVIGGGLHVALRPRRQPFSDGSNCSDVVKLSSSAGMA